VGQLGSATGTPTAPTRPRSGSRASGRSGGVPSKSRAGPPHRYGRRVRYAETQSENRHPPQNRITQTGTPAALPCRAVRLVPDGPVV